MNINYVLEKIQALKMIKKYFLLLILAGLLFVFTLPIILADEPEMDFVFKNNEPINLKRVCINNGTWCSSSAICNITIQYPNATLLVDNKEMTNQLSFHSYSIYPTANGIYFAAMICYDGADTGSDTFYFKVTPTGDEQGFGLFIVLIISSAVLLFVSYLFSNDASNYLAFLSGVFFMIAGIYSMIYGINDVANLYTRTVAIISIGLGFIFMFASAYEFTKAEDY